jgi:hypothetical protein
MVKAGKKKSSLRKAIAARDRDATGNFRSWGEIEMLQALEELQISL